MGRTAGVTAAGTQQRLLRAAADVSARRGDEGARVADIATEAGLSNGALYACFGSKADLLVQALVAARRDADVGAQLGADVRDRTDWLAALVREAHPPTSAQTGHAP